MGEDAVTVAERRLRTVLERVARLDDDGMREFLAALDRRVAFEQCRELLERLRTPARKV